MRSLPPALSGLLCLCALAACGGTTTPHGDAAVTTDAASSPDGSAVTDARVPPPDGDDPPSDVNPPVDVTTGPDALSPPDATTPTDAIAPPDAVVPRDGATPPDALSPPDAGPPMDLTGVWRAVGLRSTLGDGSTIVLTDRNAPVRLPSGVTYDTRVDGLMQVSATQIAQSAAVLYNDRSYADSTSMAAFGSLSTWGFGATGTAGLGSFTIGTTRLGFDSNADGTVTLRYDSGTEVTWARTMLPAGTAALSVDGQASVFQPPGSGSMPLSNLRVTLAWDLPAGGYTYGSDQGLSFGPFQTADYHFDLAAPPAESVRAYDSTNAALAYILVYDDVDHSRSYGGPGSTDHLRGLSTAAIAWRSSGVASASFASSPLRSLLTGFHVAFLGPDYSTGRLVPLPFDPTTGISADVAVNYDVETTPVPDLVR